MASRAPAAWSTATTGISERSPVPDRDHGTDAAWPSQRAHAGIAGNDGDDPLDALLAQPVDRFDDVRRVSELRLAMLTK